MKCYETTIQEETKLRELTTGMDRLSDRGRDYIHHISRTLFAVQGSLVLPIPPEKDEAPVEPWVRKRGRLPGKGW
jgi:hypothetical protein